MSTAGEWTEEEILPISALSHHLYCERQNALIHVEGVFQENELTVSGNVGHTYIDAERSGREHGLHRETSLPVFSDALGLNGIADVVEFPEGAPPFPIDYKNGRIQAWSNHEAQLCAIAMCLEEMFQVDVPAGAIYHIQSRRRRDVPFTAQLRALTLRCIDEIRTIFRRQILPPPVNDRRCRRCSLIEICMPAAEPARNIEHMTDA